MSIIAIDNLSKSYGTVKAVDNFSLAADEGQILALVGPDGAGKTTTFRAASGLIGFDGGEIRISGFDIIHEFNKVKPLLGYMPQIFSLYPDLSVEENLNFYSGLFGLEGKTREEKKKLLYNFSGLYPFRGRRASALSGGMKQKLALSCALIHDPKILILDEPTTGVDPLSRRQFWDILKNFKAQGTTILISTPYMDEVALADKATFIFGGRALAEGTPEQLRRKFSGKVYQINIYPTSESMGKLIKIGGISSRRFGSSVHIYVPEDQSIKNYNDEFEKIGIMPDHITQVEPELEDTFIQLMSK
jgi:ABC-2 type transport system ATP-binding protein